MNKRASLFFDNKVVGERSKLLYGELQYKQQNLS
jgi:hypothetical protein